jgi:hypothetical protein
MAPPNLDVLQRALWDSAPEKNLRRAGYVIADMHACVSRAHAALPPVGTVISGTSHKTPFFEFLSDACVLGLNLLSQHKQDVLSFPNEPMTFEDIPELIDAVPYLHRMLSGAYINVRRGRELDELFFVQVANFVYCTAKIATKHARDLRKIIVSRHIRQLPQENVLH